MIKSFNHKINLNENKSLEISKIYKEYIRVAMIVSNLQMIEFYKTGYLSKSNNLYKPIKTFLSERYKDVIKRQVDGILKSYISNRKNDFVKQVFKSTLNKEEVKELCIINKNNDWFQKDNLLARKIFKHIIKLNNLPCLKFINMQLNTKVYKLTEAKNDNTFKYWIRLCTGSRGIFIEIPLYKNTYCEKNIGEFNNGIQLNFKNNILNKIVLTKIIENKKDIYVSKTDRIGVDIGLKCLMSTNYGDIFSQHFMDSLLKYDNYLSTLQKNLQKNGILKIKSTKRYSNKSNKLKAFIKNEVNRILNRIIEIYKPKEMNFENLNFQNSKMSKRMNRLINNFGLNVIKQKLNSLNETYGIIIKYNNPAYTSQECSSCGYIDKNNRKVRDSFVCLHCGAKIHADVNAARNVIRRSNYNFDQYTKYNKIFQSLADEFIRKWFRNNNSYLSLTALIKDNKYKTNYIKAFDTAMIDMTHLS